MKRNVIFLLILIIVLIFMSGIINVTYGQPQPPPDLNGMGGNQGRMPSGAPIGDGAWILVALVVGYGVHTLRNLGKEHREE